MRADKKTEIIDACFGIGLRALQGVFASVESSGDKLVCEIANIIRQEYPRLDEATAVRQARETVHHLLQLVAHGVVRRIARSVGAPALIQLHKAYLAEQHRNRPEESCAAIELANVAMQLDQVALPFPQAMSSALRAS